MNKRTSLLAAALLVSSGCRPTTHAVEPSTLGVARSASAFEALVDRPGPVSVETVIGADWEISREGLINLDHPRARAAGLKDGPEPIQVAFHALRHPDRGLFLVDTGVERALRDDRPHAIFTGVLASFMNIDRMVVRDDTRSWLERQPTAPAGVFLTHLHADHVSGMRDVPAGTPVYVGPGEADERALQNIVVAPVIDAALAGKGPLRSWRFSEDPENAFAGVLDVFGDGTVWALSVPGHTPGSTAYLARTPGGPVLLVGDASHTRWGWENDVEPGTFSDDKAASAVSLNRLRALVRRHPSIDVRLGHQLAPRAAAPAAAGASAAPAR